MNRDDFEKFVIQNYDASFDYPWKKSPENEVFRHKNSKKWFALVMNVQKKWLGSDEEGWLTLSISNVTRNLSVPYKKSTVFSRHTT